MVSQLLGIKSVSSNLFLESRCSYSKQSRRERGAECAGTGSDHYSARNLRQRLSPKAKPWDNGNTDQGKRQALSRIEGLVASLERVVMLIPSHSFLLSCESCKSCQNVFSASFRALRETVLICVHPCPNILCELHVSARNIFFVLSKLRAFVVVLHFS
jgi:hypothetical protein